MGLFSPAKNKDLDSDVESKSSVRARAEERSNSVFEISKPTLIQDSFEVAALIDTWATKTAMARRKYSLTKAARDAALNDAKLTMRSLLEGEKKVTNDVVESKAMQDPKYRKLVEETIYAEEEFNKANGKLNAAFTKASMLKGLLFALGKEMRISDDIDLSSLPDLPTNDTPFGQ